jgi:hypothetical protein
LTASGANTYVWDQAGGTGNTLTFIPGGTVTVGVTGTLTGCATTGSSSVVVTVKPKPSVGVNSPTICSGQTATLTGTGATTYTWSGGLTGSPSAITPVLNSSTSYTVTGTTNGCTGTAVASVTVNQTPNTALGASTNNTCGTESVTLTASGADSYTWTPSGSGTIQTVTPASTVTYTVTGTTGSCTKSASQTITVTTPPSTPTLTQSGDTLYSDIIIAGASYKWYKNDTLVATTSTSSYHFTSNGDYTLEVVDHTCSSPKSAIFSAVFTAIRNSSNSIKVFEVYPNPTEGKLTLNLTLNKVSSIQISIFSPEGRELYMKSYASARAVYEELNLNALASGVYVIKLTVDSETFYHKVVKD